MKTSLGKNTGREMRKSLKIRHLIKTGLVRKSNVSHIQYCITALDV